MRFLADESCDFTVVRALRAAGHDVRAVADVSRGAPDEQVIDLALQESRVLLTEDKDFGQLVFASAGESPGVVFIRFPANVRKAMTDAVVRFVEENSAKIGGRFSVVQPGRIRIFARGREE